MERTTVALLRSGVAIALIVLGICGFCFSAFSQEPKTTSTKQLIDLLVSTNKPPFWKDDESEAEEKGYVRRFDHKAQERVFEAWNILLSRGTAALPELIEHLEDRRYSYNDNDKWNLVSVGGVCEKIIVDQVDIHARFFRTNHCGFIPSRISRAHQPDMRHDTLRAWWSKNKDKSLHQLQSEAVNWAIGYLEARGTAGIAPERDDEYAQQMAGLKKLRTRLKSSNSPIRIDWQDRFLGDDSKIDPEASRTPRRIVWPNPLLGPTIPNNPIDEGTNSAKRRTR